MYTVYRKFITKRRWYVVSVLFICLLPLSWVYAGSSYDRHINGAVSWLVGAQNMDGSWGQDDALKVVYTAESVISLRAVNRMNNAYYRGLTWLENHAAGNTDYVARRILALFAHGSSIDVPMQRLQLAKRIDANGKFGWGISTHYLAEPLDSALVLSVYANAGQQTDISGAIDFLQATQHQDAANGNQGWSAVYESNSDIVTTSRVILGLLHHGDSDTSIASAINNAVSSLEKLLDGVPAPSMIQKAHAVIAMLKADPENAKAKAVLTGLVSQQTSHGSWQSNSYTTALILRVLAIASGMDDTDLLTPVYIPDEALRKAINSALSRNANDLLTRGDLLELVSLDLTGLGIRDLRGLEQALNLAGIILSGNNITDIAPLSSLPLLTSSFLPTVTTGAAVAGDTYSDLSGSVVTNGLGGSMYIEWGQNQSYTEQIPTHPYASDEVSVSLSERIVGLTPETTYHYRLVATNAAGTVYGEDAVFTTTAERNMSPVAADDAVITREETSVTLSVLANDQDPDGDAIQLLGVSDATTLGELEIVDDEITYTPGINFTGIDRFSYQIEDEDGKTSSAEVTVSVLPHNLPGYYVLDEVQQQPRLKVVSLVDDNTIAVNDTVALTLSRYETGSITAGLSPGALLSGKGDFVVSADEGQSILLAPARYMGLTYILPTTEGLEDKRLVIFSPWSPAEIRFNEACESLSLTVPQNQRYIIDETSFSGTVNGPCVLRSDVAVLLAEEHIESGFKQAIPPASRELYGLNSSTVQLASVSEKTLVRSWVSDSQAAKSHIVGLAQTPIQLPGNYHQGQAHAVRLLADKPIFAVSGSDGDGDSAALFLPPELLYTHYVLPVDTQYLAVTCIHGSSTISINIAGTSENKSCNGNGQAPGKLYLGDMENGRHLPAGSYLESDQPIYVVYEDSNTEQEYILYGATNSAPIAADDIFSAQDGGSKTLNVLQNDQDIEGDTLTIESVTQGAHGTVVIQGSSLVYTPEPGYSGSDEFSYTVVDPGGRFDVALVMLKSPDPEGNQASVLAINEPLSMPRGSKRAITKEMLKIADPDSADEDLVFIIEKQPKEGYLEFSDAPGTPIDRFTQADINAGRVIYVHIGLSYQSAAGD